MTPDKAELQYLLKVKRLDLYGVDMHYVLVCIHSPQRWLVYPVASATCYFSNLLSTLSMLTYNEVCRNCNVLYLP